MFAANGSRRELASVRLGTVLRKPAGLAGEIARRKEPGSAAMKSCHLHTGLIALAAFAFMDAAPAFAYVEGVWLVKDGSTMRIRNCGDGVCGYIASNAPSAGDSSQGNRSMVGVQVLRTMHPAGPGKWTGRLYNPKDGNTYTGNLIEVGPDAIRIEGCWLGICGGENLTRARSTASSSR
jgi:uncharacterized protein (DUF2147 family)